MEALVVACLGFVTTIATAVQGVATIHDRCRNLVTQIQTLQPLLEQVLEQTQARKKFPVDSENALRRLKEVLERAAKTVQGLKNANQFKLAIMSTSINGDLKDISSDIYVWLSSLNLMSLGIQTDIREQMERTRHLLEQLKNDFLEQSSRSAAEVAKFQEKCMDALRHPENGDYLQAFADMFSTDRKSISTDLQDFKDWRMRSKAADMDLMFEQLLFVLSELDRKSCHACARTINTMQELQCPICKMPFTNPVIAIPSGYTYCKKCWENNVVQDPASRCSMTRERSEVIPNRAVEDILKMAEHRTRRKFRWSDPAGMDVPEAARKFQSKSPGGILMGLRALQAHSGASPGKGQIAALKSLVTDLVCFAFSSNKGKPPGTLQISLQILEDLTALRGPPQDVLTKDELEVVYNCLKEKGLEHLVALMCTRASDCQQSAAQVMVNVIEGSWDCFCLATAQNGLVTAFYELAREPATWTVGLEGLRRLAQPQYGAADTHGGKDEVLVGVLMDLIRDGVGVEECLVALGSVMASPGVEIFPCLLEGATHLVSLMPEVEAGHGLHALVKILLRMAEDVQSTNVPPHQRAVALQEILKSKGLAQRIIKELAQHEEVSKCLDEQPKHIPEERIFDILNQGDRLGGQEDCILLLGHAFKYGGWRCEADQVPFLFDILLQEAASSKSRIQILEILDLERRWHVLDEERVAKLLLLTKQEAGFDSTVRSSVAKKLCSLVKVQRCFDGVVKAGGVQALCSVAAKDTDLLCRSYAIIALESLATRDETRKMLGETLTLSQLVPILKSECLDEATGAAAALISMLISKTTTESEPDHPEELIRDALGSLVTFLRTDSPYREKAAETLTHLIVKRWEIARDWVVVSNTDVLDGLVKVARKLPADSRWRGQLYGTLSLMCSDTDCQNAVIEARGQVLLMEAVVSGSHPAATLALAGLLVRGDFSEVNLDKVVKCIKGRLKRPKVDPVMVQALAILCGGRQGTAISVVQNGGINALLDVIRRCTPECQSHAALGISKLASWKPSQVDVDQADLHPSPPERWKSQILEENGVAILLDYARGSRCIEAAEALSALAGDTSAQAKLASNLADLCKMCKEAGTEQGLLLNVIRDISPGLSQQAVSNLTKGDFPDLLLALLKQQPSFPSAATGLTILRELCVASAFFRKHVLKLGAVQVLLQVLAEGASLAATSGLEEEIREHALGAVEVVLREGTETTVSQFLGGGGVKVVTDVLQNCAAQEQSTLSCAGVKVLAHLSRSPLPKPVRKSTWKQISSAQIFGAVTQALHLEGSQDSIRAAIQVLLACVQDTSDKDKAALCKKLRDEGAHILLAELRNSRDVNVLEESHKLINLLANLCRTTKKAFKEEIDRVDRERDATPRASASTNGP